MTKQGLFQICEKNTSCVRALTSGSAGRDGRWQMLVCHISILSIYLYPIFLYEMKQKLCLTDAGLPYIYTIYLLIYLYPMIRWNNTEFYVWQMVVCLYLYYLSIYLYPHDKMTWHWNSMSILSIYAPWLDYEYAISIL